MNDKLKFPDGFLWGAATASYQVEGGIENCDWAQAAREKKVPVCGRACDHYNRYEEDFDIAKSLGHTAHRFSVEWARIEPEEGKFDEAAIEHYRTVLQALRERGMEPYVTLWHFTLPQWFSESGGWKRSDAPDVFARYCAHVVEKTSDLASHYATINEPTVYASNGWIRGIWPPFNKFSAIAGLSVIRNKLELEECAKPRLLSPLTYFRVRRTLARAHNAAYTRIKQVAPDADVSVVRDVIVFAGGTNPALKLVAGILNWHWTHAFMNATRGHHDSIGLNYYFYNKLADKAAYKKTDMYWDVVPEKIEQAALMLQRYNLPVYVAEAGLADGKDALRADYIQDTVRGIHRAMSAGLDVHAFFYWSLLDNYEWAAGFGERFGLIEVNYDTLERAIRPSAYVYKEIIENNAVDAT